MRQRPIASVWDGELGRGESGGGREEGGRESGMKKRADLLRSFFFFSPPCVLHSSTSKRDRLGLSPSRPLGTFAGKIEIVHRCGLALTCVRVHEGALMKERSGPGGQETRAPGRAGEQGGGSARVGETSLGRDGPVKGAPCVLA